MKKRILISIIVGAILGFLYYKFIGCYSGTCAITSNPVISTIYGAILFSLVAELLHDVVLLIKKKLMT